MWPLDRIHVEISEIDEACVLVVIATPAGVIELLGEITIRGRTLTIDRAHIDGLHRGACGRAGLNAIGRKLLEVADVDEILIQGSARSTGRSAGKIPQKIRFPNG